LFVIQSLDEYTILVYAVI